jgi:hypothetical protein
MVLFRVLLGLLALAAVGCFVAYMSTGQAMWRARGLAIVKWTMLAALAFFAVLAVERLLEG